jgi:hypothetical protein
MTTIGVCGLTGRAVAQSAPEFPYLAAVTADDFVRAGADVRFYPFGNIRTGDVVKVVGEKAGWARVVTIGPTFEEFYGFIRYAGPGTSFRLSLDGTGGSTIGPTDLFAPNLDAQMDPASSWRPTITLEANRTLHVIETIELSDEVVHKVALPPDAEGWIDLRRLRPVTPSELAAWEAAIQAPAARPQPVADEAATPVTQTPVGRAQLNVGVSIETVDTPTDIPAIDDASVSIAPRPLSPERRRARIMLDDLEGAYARLVEEPIEVAEVGPLRLLYVDLAKRSGDSRAISRFAQTRAQQLSLWAEVQQRRIELDDALDLSRRTTESAEASRLAMEALDHYVASGRLDASTIYDGKRLPKLLRVRDEQGRTLAYVEPDERFEYANLLGHRVGIVGEATQDSGLQVTLIEVRRIDLLDGPE